MRKLTVLLATVLVAACTAAPSWKPAGDRILTTWGESLDPAHVHAEYPRPQMVRETWKSLNGFWKYAIVPQEEQNPVCDSTILVPFCVESALSGVGKRVSNKEALWYETVFSVPNSWRKGGVMLNFEAVDWFAEIYVNGHSVGTHSGGYTHFGFDIAPYLNKGKEQLLRVKVTDATDTDFQPCGKQVTVPRGIWYTPVTGIWQSVWMEPVPSVHITDYEAVADPESGSFSITVNCAGNEDLDTTVEVEVLSAEGALIASAVTAPGEPVSMTVPDPQLWTPDTPYLYGLRLTLRRGEEDVDRVTGYAAMRSVSMVVDKDGYKRLGLNGKPIFHYGPLDQGWWPDGLYTAPSDEALKFDIQKTKDFGYNMIRKHIKIEPRRWYYWCDVLGVMVWQDMPCIAHNKKGQWDEWTYGGEDYEVPERAKENYYREWGEIIAQNKVSPCIVVWVPFNEGWGQFDTEQVVAFTHDLDPTRLINPASGGNHRHCGDILDSHNYPMPKMKLRSNGEVIDVLGEYGGIGWPVDGHLWQADKNWGYVKYTSGEEVLAEYERFAEMLKGIIKEGVAGAVYTQTTDVEVEVNGLMTYDRKVIKMDEPRLRDINQRVIQSMQE